jgi:NAD(P)-dependent dehydrogenase (short-subunit alcohol dehydrogenase family)
VDSEHRQHRTDEGSTMTLGSDSDRAVAIVTGGAFPAGREIARGLASWSWPVVVVYLDHQGRAEATVEEIISAGGTTIAVRADLADDLDVQRLYTESTTEFGGVDVVVHTTSNPAALLCRHATRHIRRHGAILITSAPDMTSPLVASQLREREITIERVRQAAVLDYLDQWRQQNGG